MRSHNAGLLVAAVAVITLGAAAPAPNTLTPEEQRDGWKLLFDGTSTSGWRGFKKDACPAGWKAVDGALTRVAQAGDIVTADEYVSFDFKFDWRLAKNGNSGVFFHVAEAPEFDTAVPHRAGVPAARQRGASRRQERPGPLVGRQLRAARALEEHRPSDRRVEREPHRREGPARRTLAERREGGRVQGSGGQDWKNRVAKSKFNAMPRYGLEKTGHIALQDHGFEVAFRNMKIKVLP